MYSRTAQTLTLMMLRATARTFTPAAVRDNAATTIQNSIRRAFCRGEELQANIQYAYIMKQDRYLDLSSREIVHDENTGEILGRMDENGVFIAGRYSCFGSFIIALHPTSSNDSQQLALYDRTEDDECDIFKSDIPNDTLSEYYRALSKMVESDGSINPPQVMEAKRILLDICQKFPYEGIPLNEYWIESGIEDTPEVIAFIQQHNSTVVTIALQCFESVSSLLTLRPFYSYYTKAPSSVELILQPKPTKASSSVALILQPKPISYHGSRKPIYCRFYQTGSCNKGIHCKFLHEFEPTPFPTQDQFLQFVAILIIVISLVYIATSL